MVNQSVSQFVHNIQELMAQKKWLESKDAVEQFKQAYPEEVAAWILAAQCAMQTGQLGQAAAHLEKARQLTPNDLMLMWQQLKVWESLGQFNLAIPLALHLADLMLDKHPHHLDILKGLAVFLMTHHQFIKADKVWNKVNQMTPNNPSVLLNLATIKQYQGDHAAAELIAESILTVSPAHPDVLYFLAYLKRHKDSSLIKVIKGALNQLQMPLEIKAKLYYALAKIFEDIELYPKSFEFRKKGANLFRASFAYKVEDDIRFIKQIKETYSKDLVQSTLTFEANNSPVFIVGLPRSGTTLLERMIGNHDDVKSAGELIYFNRLMTLALQQKAQGCSLSNEQMVQASVDLDFSALGRSYIECAEASLGKQKRFIDKHPINALYLGLIHKALPNAKFIILDRNPMDICYAVYKQLFAPGIYQFSYDLKEMADYYQSHADLMDHWQDVMPEAVHRVKYEDLVNDTEATAKGVLAFCDLTWQNNCLDLSQNTQASATASASQVRGRVYSSSVGLWKKYAEELSELKQTLEN